MALDDVGFDPALPVPSMSDIQEYYTLYPDVATLALKNGLDRSKLISFMNVVVNQNSPEARCGALYGDPGVMLLWISGEGCNQVEHRDAIVQALTETSEILVATPYSSQYRQACIMAAWGRMRDHGNARLTADFRSWAVAQEVSVHDESVANGAAASFKITQ